MKRIIILTVILLFNFTLSAAIINVPSTQPTIQAGIDAASVNDTVLVAPGTYTGDGNRDLSFNGKNLVLLSEAGAETTIIDIQATAEDWHIAIHLDNGEDSTSLIDGFTFINSYYNVWGFQGGALMFENGKANIQNCIISASHQNAIYLRYTGDTSIIRISDCIIEKNTTGIYNGKAGTLIENCIVRDNTYSGIEFFMPTEIRNCLVVHNGIGIAHSVSVGLPPVLIDHCTIAYNNIGFSYEITPPKNNSDVLIEVDTGTVSYSIIAYNSYAGIINNFVEDAHYNCISSNVFGNGMFDWQNDKYSAGDEFGNISRVPRFCDSTAENYYLGESSVCAAANSASGQTIGVYDVGCGCCVGIRGNMDNDYDDVIDISDLVSYVLFMFDGGSYNCPEEMNVNASPGGGLLAVDIADLVYLVAYMFSGGPEPFPCYL